MLVTLLLVAAAGGMIGGAVYYGVKTALDPCAKWNWGEALFWTGLGGVMGAAIGGLIYGGWWVGVQFGWWGATGGGALGGIVAKVVEVGKQEMERIVQSVDLGQATAVVKRMWSSASVTYGQVNQYIINYYAGGNRVATVHQVETLSGEVVHTDFKSVIIEGVEYIVR